MQSGPPQGAIDEILQILPRAAAGRQTRAEKSAGCFSSAIREPNRELLATHTITSALDQRKYEWYNPHEFRVLRLTPAGMEIMRSVIMTVLVTLAVVRPSRGEIHHVTISGSTFSGNTGRTVYSEEDSRVNILDCGFTQNVGPPSNVNSSTRV